MENISELHIIGSIHITQNCFIYNFSGIEDKIDNKLIQFQYLFLVFESDCIHPYAWILAN